MASSYLSHNSADKVFPKEECAPRPAAMISSLRAFGYDLSMAISDLIDNSLYAQARNIAVDYDWNEGNPWLRVLDDGVGMSEKRLREAMRLGSQSPLDVRAESDLGRFGLGLKTASFSQGKLLTVCTRANSGKTSLRSWDLDHVCKSGKWEIATTAPKGSAPLIEVMDTHKHGTIVLCQKLDRFIRKTSENDIEDKNAFLESFDHVSNYLEMVFHRFLSGRDRVKISVGRHECQPWDPFLTSNTYTQLMSPESLDSHRVKVKPFVLPHVSKRTQEETERGAGLRGWNAQQGFYVYRNKRMIISGGYLDLRRFTAEEHYKLCRIQVDLPNNLDHEWRIDVRKAAASPPSKVRSDLERIARATRAQASAVYRARAGGSKAIRVGPKKNDVWLKKKKGDKVTYQINRENEAIRRIINELSLPNSWVKNLFHLIESTVPHRLIIMDNAEHEDCQVGLEPDVKPPPKELIRMCEKIFKDHLKSTKNKHTAADYACSVFDDHPAYRAAIDKIMEDIK